MKKCKNLLLAAKLRKLTPLVPKTRNVTRWSSSFDMLLRYTKLRYFLYQLDDEDFIRMLPTKRQNRSIDALLALLSDLESATKALQEEDMTMCNVRKLFNLVVEDYPVTDRRISETASIVANPSFEMAIVKIQEGNAASMTPEEVALVQRMCKSVSSVQTVHTPAATGSISLADRALKRRKVDDLNVAYIDTRFLVPTSNVCERFFSSAKFALDDRRMRMTPQNFEAQMFLYANRTLWGTADVQAVME
jgi:hypothetical protein